MIQIAIGCGDNSEKYASFLVNSIRKTASNLSEIQVLFGISKRNIDIDYLRQECKGIDFRFIEALTNQTCSIGHGETLDKIFPHMNSEYGMIVDCDVAFLSKGWDVLFPEILKSDEKTAIVGGEYDGKKYMNFPCIVCCCFKTHLLKKYGISFLPSRNIVVDETNSFIYNRNIGDEIFLDVGWQLCYKLKTNGYGGIPLGLARPSANIGRSKFIPKDMRGEEYQYKGIPICTHIGRSLIRNFDTDPIVLRWRTEVRKWMEKNNEG